MEFRRNLAPISSPSQLCAIGNVFFLKKKRNFLFTEKLKCFDSSIFYRLGLLATVKVKLLIRL